MYVCIAKHICSSYDSFFMMFYGALPNAYNTNNNMSLVGFARVSAESDRSYPTLPWVLPVGLSAKALSSVFTLDWICRFSLFYH